MHSLIIQDDEGNTTVFPVTQDAVTIGRADDNALRLPERNVSRHHARIVCTEAGLCLEDLNSYTGVRLNGQSMHGRATLREADRFQIGDYLIEVHKSGRTQRWDIPLPVTGDATTPTVTSSEDVFPTVAEPLGEPTAEWSAAERTVTETVALKTPRRPLWLGMIAVVSVVGVGILWREWSRFSVAVDPTPHQTPAQVTTPTPVSAVDTSSPLPIDLATTETPVAASASPSETPLHTIRVSNRARARENAPVPVTPVPTAVPNIAAAPPTTSGVIPTFEAALLNGKTAYHNRQYADALDHSEAALKLRPFDDQALSIASLSACRIGNVAKATSYANRLKGQRRDLVKQLCQQAGVLLP